MFKTHGPTTTSTPRITFDVPQPFIRSSQAAPPGIAPESSAYPVDARAHPLQSRPTFHVLNPPGKSLKSLYIPLYIYIYSWQLLNKPYEDLILSGSGSWSISLISMRLISMRSALLRGIWPYFPTSYKLWDGPPNTIHPQSKSFDDLWTASLLRFQDTMPLGCLGFYPIKTLWTDKIYHLQAFSTNNHQLSSKEIMSISHVLGHVWVPKLTKMAYIFFGHHLNLSFPKNPLQSTSNKQW